MKITAEHNGDYWFADIDDGPRSTKIKIIACKYKNPTWVAYLDLENGLFNFDSYAIDKKIYTEYDFLESSSIACGESEIEAVNNLVDNMSMPVVKMMGHLNEH